MVHLAEQGWASQQEGAQAFGYSARTLARNQQRFDADGLASVGRGGGYPKGRWLFPPCGVCGVFPGGWSVRSGNTALSKPSR